ncbi:MAG: recombinase family protein [Terracidiphilus sp.]|jgi:DNA invertase Pin-like site-specific DNA recombinase
MNVDGQEEMCRAKRVALYMRVSLCDKDPNAHVVDLRQMAVRDGFEVVAVYTDKTTGTTAKQPGLDQLLVDARRRRFDIVMTWSCDRMARSTRHFVKVLDEFIRIGVEFRSHCEAIDTGGPQGSAFAIIVGAITELEHSLIGEKVRTGMRRARLDGQLIGRKPLQLDHAAIHRDRRQGHSIRAIAKEHGISTATVQRVLRISTADLLERAA